MVELPKNLKPKTKVAIFKLRNIGYAILFSAITFYLISKIDINYKVNIVLNMCVVIIDLIIILYERDGRDFAQLFVDNIKYLVMPKYLIYDKKIIKEEKKRKRVEKTEEDKINELNRLLNIQDVQNQKGKDGYYYKYLEIKIKKNPGFENPTQKKLSIEDFNRLLLEIEKNSNGKIFTLNVPIHDKDYEQNLIKNVNNKAYYNLKKFQLNNAKGYFNLRYFIEIRSEELELLEIRSNTLINTFSRNLEVLKIDDNTYNEIIQDKHNYTDIDIKSNYVYNNKLNRYECYMSLKGLNTKQDYYYLRSIFSSGYDISLMYRKPKDFSDMKTLNSAFAELQSSQKYDKTMTGIVKNKVQERQLYRITTDLEMAKGELFSIDFIVKVVANDLETLNQRITQLHVHYKGKLELLDNIYKQKSMVTKFHKFGVDISDKYIIPDEHLSYSYPFNFVKFVQKGGLLKNADRENLLILDYQKKGGNQLSFGFMIFGDKGSGKSTFLKEKSLDDIYHYNGNVIMIDFDSETETMVNNFGGSFVDIAGMPINILRVNINPLATKNVEDHIVFVSNCLTVLYEDINERYLRKIISEVYNDFGVTNDSIFEKHDYPTISDIKDKIANNKEVEAQKLFDILSDMDMLYPYLTQVDRGFEFDNKLISISFNSIKRNDILTNMMMYYFVTLISRRTSLNHFEIKYYQDDDEKLQKYLKYYMKLINDEKNYEKVCKYGREDIKKYFDKNKKMFSIYFDEAHRIFKYPTLVQNLIPIAREDRKYFTSLIFADQSTHSLETNSDFLLIYSLMQYKIFFSLEETNKTFLNKLNFLKKEIKDITEGKFEAGEGILKMGDKTYKINSRITKEIDELFEGRN